MRNHMNKTLQLLINRRKPIFHKSQTKWKNIEDDCAELDVKITRNKNVYRNLILYGYEYAIRSPMLLEELKKKFMEKRDGFFFCINANAT